MDDLSGPPAIHAAGLEKRFSGVRALGGVDLAVGPGEIRALVGENGAGKSTLIKVLAGALVPDAGVVELLGEALAFGRPAEAGRLGVAVIHQEPAIVPQLDAVENAFLGRWPTRAGIPSRRRMRADFAAWCEQLGVQRPGGGPAGELPIADQRVTELVRVMLRRARIVLMDEPTASLPPGDRAALIRAVATLKKSGIAVVFISHQLDEVLQVADSVTVLRDAGHVFSRPAHELTQRDLVSAMLGRQATDIEERPRRAGGGAAALSVRSLSVASKLNGIDLDVAQGESVGIAGLVGSGRSTLLRALSGAQPGADGTVCVGGETAGKPPRSPAEGLRRGIGLVPEDRRRLGLVLGAEAAENVVLAKLGSRSAWGLTSPRTSVAQASDAASAVGFPLKRLRQPARSFSGGNQQRLVLARLLSQKPKVLLLDEPMRGIDVGARAAIAMLLRRLSDEGTALVVASEEIEDLVALCDRVVVLTGGQIGAELTGDEISEEAILPAMFDAAERAR